MAPEKKIPMRQCLGCREMKPKADLIRIVRSPEGSVSMDLKGRAQGRGAYLCRNVDCLKRAIKGRALERVFSVKIDNAIAEALQQEMEEQP